MNRLNNKPNSIQSNIIISVFVYEQYTFEPNSSKSSTMNLLNSIKPKFVKKSISKEKRIEFQKKIPKAFESTPIFIYASAPVQKIIGKFKPKTIICDSPNQLWIRCAEGSGIDEPTFMRYFEGKQSGYAIEIADLEVFDPPIDPYEKNPEFHAPQSYCFLEKDLI